ncbi:hypothetical protein PR048_013991 [Dryococelus australis]|uniref:Uncharacterized protein n=1 Tax=Dryococelus australis TaxID=614101 RepID=A0ABQ9HTR2_9NEOP|nr:hypothetical protein PR048_013991 [Dryococelus australis]
MYFCEVDHSITGLTFQKVKEPVLSEEDLLQVKFAIVKLHKSDLESVIGAKSRAYIKEVNLNNEKLKYFHRSFYTRICEYIAKK